MACNRETLPFLLKHYFNIGEIGPSISMLSYFAEFDGIILVLSLSFQSQNEHRNVSSIISVGWNNLSL